MGKQQTVIFVGRSGSGKGTQADLLIGRFRERGEDCFYVQTGAQFRKFLDSDSYVARLAKDRSLKGDRQPDFMAVYMWSDLLVKEFKGEGHLIFDGSPRSLIEAKALDTALTFLERSPILVVALHISNDCATSRLTARGRNDDDEHGIKKRLAWYDADVIPALEYYRHNPSYDFVELDGERGVEEIHTEIVAHCDQRS